MISQIKSLFRRSTPPPKEKLIFYIIPSLASQLLRAETDKGSPLSEEEVIEIRDKATAVAITADVAIEMDKERGYDDVDPENCWEGWQTLKANWKENERVEPDR